MDCQGRLQVFRPEGPLTIACADAIRVSLLDILRDGGPVEIDCSAATEVDVTFVQLLLAARGSAALRGFPVALAAPASGALLDVLKRAGFLDAADPAETDFWTRAPGGAA
jgi:hypothetical protein